MTKRNDTIRDLNYYLNRPWDFEFEKAPEGGYYARVKGLFCHSYGETLTEAAENINEALECYIESCIEDEEAIPEPEYFEKCTGRISIRTSKSIHCKLEKIAKEEEVSVSHLINNAIVKMYG